MEMIRRCLFFVLLMLTVTAVKAQSNWSESFYTKYTCANYAKYKPFLAVIDLDNIDYPLLNAALFYETNLQRKRQGIPTLKHLSALEHVAQGHSQDMVEQNFFSHRSTVQGKHSMVDRFKKEGIKFSVCSENIAYNMVYPVENKSFYPPSVNGGYFSFEYKGEPLKVMTYQFFARQMVRQWMNSSGHRKNILDKEANYLGCGTCLMLFSNPDRIPRIYGTQNFCSLLSDSENIE
ncbi:CAP domain-containing protein [Limibacter armeniacum]|uniref:CAP domain-containing protein n=1 Tax=Limibacter armeniacum TaxID=466084 RepID=UPI002FE6863C